MIVVIVIFNSKFYFRILKRLLGEITHLINFQCIG